MKTQTNHQHFVVWSLLVGFTLVGAIPRTAYAETQVSNPGSGPDIFLAWTNPADPVQGIDFIVSFSDPANPDVQLKTGDTTWNVRSQLGANPGNIGNITLDPTVSTANFDLTIANGPFDPGAANVASLNLTAAGWTGHSSLGAGGIFGHLAGNLKLVKDSTGAGGEISGGSILPFTISGDVSGDIAVQVITGTGLYVKGSVSGDIDIKDRLDAGVLRIEGEETSTTTISIAEIVNGTIILGTDFFTFGNDFAGNLILGNGVPVGSSVVVNGNLTSPGTINLSGYPLAGLLRINNDASGNIINGGAASGFITLGFYPSRNFSGIATFSSLSGTIQTQSGANISGTLKILGDVAGAITMERITVQGLDPGGNLESGGRISIGGEVSGDIEVGGNVAGDISVEGDVTGTVTVNRVLESTGRILIDGLCDGAIAIGRETESLSLIRMTEGLGVNGSIAVNDSGGDFDAGGTIHVGATKTVPPIVFDGSILIKKESGGPGGGDLNGKIIVRGCHATDDDLDICICGTNNGTVTLIQTGCPPLPTLVGWSCVSGCP